MSRRKFFKALANSLAKAAAEFTYEATKPQEEFIRPPGSPDEDTFLSLCKRCGTCISSCPTGVLDKVSKPHPAILDTPFMNFDKNYCEQCYTCIKNCPSGALTFENLKHFKYVAILNKNRCVAYQDIFCQTCYWSCPQMDKAITLKDMVKPIFNSEHCKGCGRCIHSCPTIPKAIEMKKVKADEAD